MGRWAKVQGNLVLDNGRGREMMALRRSSIDSPMIAAIGDVLQQPRDKPKLDANGGNVDERLLDQL